MVKNSKSDYVKTVGQTMLKQWVRPRLRIVSQTMLKTVGQTILQAAGQTMVKNSEFYG